MSGTNFPERGPGRWTALVGWDQKRPAFPPTMTNSMLTNVNYYCRVCGRFTEEPPWGDDGECPTYEICPCCGVEAGYGDSVVDAARGWRQKWLASGANWRDAKLRPSNWRPDEQLTHIPPDFS